MRRRPVPSDRTIRVASVADAVYPWNRGGKEMRQYQLWRRLAAHGVHVEVYTMRWWGEADSVTHDGVTYHAICPLVPLYAGPRRSITQGLTFALATLRMLTVRYDVLDADVIPFLHVVPLRVVAALRRRPLTVTWHEFWGRAYWVRYLGARGLLAAALERFVAALPTKVVACSTETARRVVGRDPGDVRVVPNGVELAPLAARAAAAGPARSPLAADLIVVGRLLAHKNVDLAVRALARLGDEGVRLTMTVIGTGPEAGRLAELAAALGVADRVRFAGVVDAHEDVLDAVAGSDVMLFPSVREGFGMVALEALACGTPVVTADHPDNAAKDLIDPGVNGFVVPPTVDGLVAGIRAARELGQRTSVEETVREYDWDALAGQLAAVYREFAGAAS